MHNVNDEIIEFFHPQIRRRRLYGDCKKKLGQRQKTTHQH